LHEKVIIQEKQIKDGWQYLVDNNGNEVKDSLGNTIKVDRFKTIRSKVRKYSQFKSVQVVGQINYFDLATNQFTIGIQTNKLNLQNYLDLGYLICKHSDADKAGEMIDAIMSLNLPEEKKQFLETDWRFIILHHVSVRPYNLKE